MIIIFLNKQTNAKLRNTHRRNKTKDILKMKISNINDILTENFKRNKPEKSNEKKEKIKLSGDYPYMPYLKHRDKNRVLVDYMMGRNRNKK